MSNVHKRNRKHSQYAKYLITQQINKELGKMYAVKDRKYFPKGTYKTYDMLKSTNKEMTTSLAQVYSERVRNSGELSSLDLSIEKVNECVGKSEGCIQLMQDLYMERELYKADLTKNQEKVARRYQKIIKMYLDLSEELKGYLKTLKRKRKDVARKKDNKK